MLAVAGLAAVLITSCGTSQGGTAARSQAPDVGPSLRGARSSAAEQGGYWVTGGYLAPEGTEAARPDQIRGNNVAARYSSNGEELEQIRLPLSTEAILLRAEVVSVRGRDYLLGISCPTSESSDEAIGCTGAGAPLFVELPRGNEQRDARSISLSGASLSGATAGVPGSNNIDPVGVIGNRIIAVQGSSTPASAAEGHATVRALAIDVSSGAVEEVKLPDGVVTPSSICVRGNVLVAGAPVTNERGEVTDIRLFEQQGQSSGWTQVAEDAIPPAPAVGGSVYCLAAATVLRLETPPNPRFFVIDPSGRIRAATNGDAPTGRITYVDVTPAKLIVTTTDDTSVSYWRYDERSGWRKLGTRAFRDPYEVPAAIAVGSEVLDPGPSNMQPPSRSVANRKPAYVVTEEG